jgi:hypothetical protein
VAAAPALAVDPAGVNLDSILDNNNKKYFKCLQNLSCLFIFPCNSELSILLNIIKLIYPISDSVIVAQR